MDREHCCVHISKDNKIEQDADSNAVQTASETNWLNRILQEIGVWSLKGWMTEVQETIITVILIVIITSTVIGRVHKT